MISKLKLVVLLLVVGCIVFLLTHLSLIFNKKPIRLVNSVHVHTNNHYHKEDNEENTVVRTNLKEAELELLDPVTKDKINNIKTLENKEENKVVDNKIANEQTSKDGDDNKDNNNGNNKIVESKTDDNKQSTIDEKSKDESKTLDKEKNEDSKEAPVKVVVADSDSDKVNKETQGLPLCSKRGENLVGPLFIDQSIPKDITEVEKSLSVEYGGTVEKGGWWDPVSCKPRVKVAVVIPYRNRFEQLKIFLRHMHPFLQRQQLYYRIVVVDMLADDPFNRAGLFNIGFVESLKLDNFDCFVFTDVDLLPEDDRNYYGCPTSPRHMSVGVDKFNYQLPYQTIFGGVGSFTKEHFEKINGMSNMFWGWGGEDDDLYQRITAVGFKLSRPAIQIGRYTMIKIHHFQSSKADPNRMNLLQNSKQRMIADGLNTLKYTVKEIEESPLVTFVKIEMKHSAYLKR